MTAGWRNEAGWCVRMWRQCWIAVCWGTLSSLDVAGRLLPVVPTAPPPPVGPINPAGPDGKVVAGGPIGPCGLGLRFSMNF